VYALLRGILIKSDAFLGQGASRLRLIMTRSDVSLIDKIAEISLEENTRTTGSADPVSETDRHNFHINVIHFEVWLRAKEFPEEDIHTRVTRVMSPCTPLGEYQPFGGT
jgi:hypothetical protein